MAPRVISIYFLLTILLALAVAKEIRSTCGKSTNNTLTEDYRNKA